MREILFRGKGDKKYNNGEWHYGVPIQDYDGDWRICTCYSKRVVVPETVGQYTGLTDSNGKKIFEGDIISIPFEEDRYPYEENVIHYENAEVYFDTERYGWYVRYSDDDSLSIWEYDDRDIIVIGNIHDNSELLKGGEGE